MVTKFHQLLEDVFKKHAAKISFLGGLSPKPGFRRIKLSKTGNIYFYKKIDNKPKFYKQRKK